MKSYRELIEAKKDFPVDIIKKVKELTKVNDHNEARILVAKTIKDKKLLNAYKNIQATAEIDGHTSQANLSARQKLDKKLFDYVKKTFANGKDVYMAM